MELKKEIYLPLAVFAAGLLAYSVYLRSNFGLPLKSSINKKLDTE